MHDYVTGRKKGTLGKVAHSAGRCGDNPSGSILHPVRVLFLEDPEVLSLEEVPDLSPDEDLVDESSLVEREELLLLVAWPSCVFPR